MANISFIKNHFINLNMNILLTVVVSLFFSLVYLYFGSIINFGLVGLFFLILLSSKNIKILFYTLFLWLIVAGILINLTFLGQFKTITYIDEILVSILALFLFFRLKEIKFDNGISKLFLIILLFCFFATVSTFFNKSSFIGLLNFIFTYSKVFLIFICAVCFLRLKEIKKLILFMFFIMAIQFFVANLQFLSYGRVNILVGPEITGSSGWVDSACGLFGEYGAHKLGHFSMIFLILSISLWMFTFEKKWLFFIFICLYTFIISFTEQNYTFLIFFILLAGGAFLKKINFPFKSLAFFLILLVIFSGAFAAYKTNSKITERYFDYLNNPRKIEESGKVQSLLLVKKIISEEPHKILIGVGPGNFSGGIAAKVKGEYYEKYIGFRLIKIESTVDYWWSTFTTLISETGFIGYLLYMLIYIFIFIRGFKMYKSKNNEISNFDRGVAFALCNIILFLIYMSFWSNQLEWTVLTFPFSIISAYVWKNYDNANLDKNILIKNIK